MTFPLLFILFGLFGLWFGTKLIMNGAIGVANRFNLSHSFIGVSILAIGTDLPEVFVTLKSSFNNLHGIESSGIIIGNAIGSSISQISFILGVAGLFVKFRISRQELFRDGTVLISSIVLLFIFGIDGIIAKWEGAILVLMYLFYYLLLMQNQTNHNDDNSGVKKYSNISLMLLLMAGFVILIFSSHLVVENAMFLSEKWGVTHSFVGIVIIGLGTSLPELAVSVGAAFRKSIGMSIGNIIGSNIFDGLIPIGVGAAINPLRIENSVLRFDLVFLFLVTLIVVSFLRTKRGISVLEGIVLVSIYFIYILLKVLYF